MGNVAVDANSLVFMSPCTYANDGEDLCLLVASDVFGWLQQAASRHARGGKH